VNYLQTLGSFLDIFRYAQSLEFNSYPDCSPLGHVEAPANINEKQIVKELLEDKERCEKLLIEIRAIGLAFERNYQGKDKHGLLIEWYTAQQLVSSNPLERKGVKSKVLIRMGIPILVGIEK
jgi:hypothetical protein